MQGYDEHNDHARLRDHPLWQKQVEYGCEFASGLMLCGDCLLVGYLRLGNIDPARHAPAILKLLVVRLRRAWPGVKITFWGDSGFCRWKMLRWCERHGVDYVVGIAKNPRLLTLASGLMGQAERAHREGGAKAWIFGWLEYTAKSWNRPRRVIAKAEHGAMGANLRFVLSNLPGEAGEIYDRICCARGAIDSRIKRKQFAPLPQPDQLPRLDSSQHLSKPIH